MRPIFATLTLLAVLGGTSSIRAQAPARLIVRLYNTAAISTAELMTARRAAESILRETGVDVVFRVCGTVSADPCAESLKPNEVVVRVIPAPAFHASLHVEVYGVAYVVRETNRGWLATVFADRIAEAAARVGVDSGTVIGRVMAHEIGHLFLGLTYHGEAGVMQAEWPDERLLNSANAWRFSTGESRRLHDVLHSLRF